MPGFSVHSFGYSCGPSWQSQSPGSSQSSQGCDDSPSPSDNSPSPSSGGDPGPSITGGMDSKTQYMVTLGLQNAPSGGNGPSDGSGDSSGDGSDGSGNSGDSGGGPGGCHGGGGHGWGGHHGDHGGGSGGPPGSGNNWGGNSNNIVYVDQNGNPISPPDGGSGDGSDGSGNGDWGGGGNYSPSPSSGLSPSPGSNAGNVGSSSGSSGSGSANNNGSSQGWNSNVGVMASSSAANETTDWYSGSQLVGGYLYDLEQGMDSGDSIDQANAAAQSKDSEGAISTGVTSNSLVKGKGGNAVIVTGDNYGNEQDADDLAAKLKQDYGMNVTVIHDASPNQLKAALQQMGQQTGQQCLVAVLAHGAHDDSGQDNGMIALGKGDGDQWLSEDDLKNEVNQYLSPNYGNVNVLLNSCYSGNFVS